MSYHVQDVARLSGVTVRTLHHYDRIGLLVPAGRSDAGYRLYGENDLLRLQQILTWRALGFSLAEIKRVLDEPGFDRTRALRHQREALRSRAAEFLAMSRSVDRTLESLEGGGTVAVENMFDGFDPAQYEDEVRENWGDTDAYRESKRRTAKYSQDDWKRIQREAAEIYERLATHMSAGLSPDAEEVAAVAETHRKHIDRWYYPCSRETHAALADLYTADPRFTAAIDGERPGLARFLADAIKAAL